MVVASVQESIDAGRVVEETGPRASRNRLQTVTLLDAITEHGYDAAFGGARRDEERARAKERIFSFRDADGQWEPRRQRPELWDLYNGRIRRGEHVRVFPLSNWTELDVWEYIRTQRLEIPSIYFAHEREVFERDGMLYAVSEFIERIERRGAVHRLGAVPDGRRHELHRRGALRRGVARRRDHRDRRHAGHRARPDTRGRPGERGGDGGPQARGLLLVVPLVPSRSCNVVWQQGLLDRAQRWGALGHPGATVWMTGLPASGKSTVAAAVEARLVGEGRPAYVLDGDNLRHGLNGDLGFSAEDRAENVRRTAEVSALLADAGVVVLVALVSPYRADRAAARAVHERLELPFLEVHVATSLEECERRDPKGLYARARAGELQHLTGVDDPYEPPDAPDVDVTGDEPLETAAERVLAALPR